MHRLGLIGDVHAEDASLRVALRRFEVEHVDAILCVGDMIDGPGDVEATVALLREHNVIAVAGNHERWFLCGQMRGLENATQTLSDEACGWLRSLPPTRRLETAAGTLMLCHGVGDDDMVRLLPDSASYDVDMNEPLQRLIDGGDVRFVVGGHTHRRMIRQFGSLTFINPGTLFRGHEPCFAVANLDPLTVDFIDL